MATLDEFLRATIETARKRFPDAGLLLIAVEDPEDEESPPAITYMTNMDQEEVTEVVGCISDPDGVPTATRH